MLSSGRRWTYGQIAEAGWRLTHQIRRLPAGSIGVSCRDAASFLAAVLGVHLAGRDVVLVPGEFQAEAGSRFATDAGAVSCLSDHDVLQFSEACGENGRQGSRLLQECEGGPSEAGMPGGRILLPTSGTTGLPKAAVHRWESLTATVHQGASYAAARWLLTYPLARFAGLQVLLQSSLSGAFLVAGVSLGPADLACLIDQERITHVSATPTFWRRLLMGTRQEERRTWGLRQLTLGGEVVAPGILAVLHREFPSARISHIYASTEMGVCLSVHDGEAGFPATWLETGRAGIGLRVEDGQLMVRSERAMQGYLRGGPVPQDWFATGDLAEIRDGRVYILGRRDEMINVGGDKVAPAEVEERIGSVPGVAAARVFGQRNAITGSFVRAEVVAEDSTDRDELRRRVLETCRSTLARHKVPRIIDIVNEIQATPAGKTSRIQVTA